GRGSGGWAGRRSPPGLEARAGRWRDQVAGKKILLLLDDAVSHEQVEPLLPGTAGSLVLVTSRRRLAALQDATVVSVDTLSPAEAEALLARLADRPGLSAGMPPWGRSPGCADTCRWRSGCWPASCAIAERGRLPGWPTAWLRRGTGWR